MRWVNDKVSIFLSVDRRVWRSDDEGFQYVDITPRLFNASNRGQAPEFIYVSQTDTSKVTLIDIFFKNPVY